MLPWTDHPPRLASPTGRHTALTRIWGILEEQPIVGKTPPASGRTCGGDLPWDGDADRGCAAQYPAACTRSLPHNRPFFKNPPIRVLELRHALRTSLRRRSRGSSDARVTRTQAAARLTRRTSRHPHVC